MSGIIHKMLVFGKVNIDRKEVCMKERKTEKITIALTESQLDWLNQKLLNSEHKMVTKVVYDLINKAMTLDSKK